MKITIDTETNIVKLGRKNYDDLEPMNKEIVAYELANFLSKNTKMTEYETDCMWMSYRYCIGRHTIAAHMHANNIWQHCKGRMDKEQELFNAYDINREIEAKLSFGHNFPSFYFPVTSLNRIYTPAVDIVCQFIEDYNIKNIKDLCKYKDVYIRLGNNNSYDVDPVTWEEDMRPIVHQVLSRHFDNNDMSEDYAWNYFEKWHNEQLGIDPDLADEFRKISDKMPNPEYCYMHNFEDLFVWNDLVHCFDHEHHHKSILTDGTECEWFWSWTNKTEKHDDGMYYRTFGYKKIRVPIDKWNGSITTWIPDSSIKKDLY